MAAWIIPVCILVVLIVILVIRNHYELGHLAKTFYDIQSEKLADGKSLKAVLLADLHGRTYGDDNCGLIRMIKEEEPDIIFLAGDMITYSMDPDIPALAKILKELREIAPVYYSPGNHEKKLKRNTNAFDELYPLFEETGVRYMENTRADLEDNISVAGLDIGGRFYKKLKGEKYTAEDIKKDLPIPDENRYNIVLAHSPKFFDTYAEYGADLFLAGHYHGGAIRIGRNTGVISPQFVPFPGYSKGIFTKGRTQMIVTAGCGSHKVNLRIGNKPEVVIINIHGNLI